MTAPDRFEFDDAAYVLGALAPDERAAFEEHLDGCPACSTRVREIVDVPSLLSGIGAAELSGMQGPPPETLLPGLLRRATGQRRRQRRLLGGLAALAAACVIALTVALWPSSTPSTPRRAAARPFTAVQSSPVRATAVLTAKAWGTAIVLDCHYVSSEVERAFVYQLVVYDRAGRPHAAGDWKLPPERDITYPTGTSVPLTQITKIEITLPSGTAILRLTV